MCSYYILVDRHYFDIVTLEHENCYAKRTVVYNKVERKKVEPVELDSELYCNPLYFKLFFLIRTHVFGA